MRSIGKTEIESILLLKELTVYVKRLQRNSENSGINIFIRKLLGYTGEVV